MVQKRLMGPAWLIRISFHLLLLLGAIGADDLAANFGPTGPYHAVMLVELADDANAQADLQEWDIFAGRLSDTNAVRIQILCRTAAQKSLSKFMTNVEPSMETDGYSWSTALTRLQTEYPDATYVGLFAAGTLPHEGMERAITAVDAAFREYPQVPTAIVSRSKIRGRDEAPAEEERSGQWLSDKYVAQAWCNPSALTEARLSEANLEQANVQDLSILDVISHLLRGHASRVEAGDADATHLVDGTYVLRSTVRGYPQDLAMGEPLSTQHDSKRMDFSIGGLGMALVSSDMDARFLRANASVARGSITDSPWPPSYVLETAASKEGLVIVTSVNCGYLDMATNFLQSVQRQSNAKVLFVATDDVAFDFLDTLSPGCVVYASNSAKSTHATKAGEFGDATFKAEVNVRPDILLGILTQGYAALWSDVDIVWLGNPLLLLPSVGHPNGADVVAPRDHLQDLCTCFIFLRSTEKAVELMRRWKFRIVSTRSVRNQWAFQGPVHELAAHSGLKVEILNRAAMPPGIDFFTSANMESIDKEVVVVHNNCIKGHENKVNRFKNFGLWSVEETSFPICE